MTTAPTRTACGERLQQIAADLRQVGQGAAAETVLRDVDGFALYLVFEVVERLAQHWRKMGGSNLCRLVLAGVRFADGQMANEMAA